MTNEQRWIYIICFSSFDSKERLSSDERMCCSGRKDRESSFTRGRKKERKKERKKRR